jgi:hypothetical protein
VRAGLAEAARHEGVLGDDVLDRHVEVREADLKTRATCV